MENFIIKLIIFSLQFVFAAAGCSGGHDIGVQIGTPNTHIIKGRVTYLAPDVHSLANQLMLDIPSLTLEYANVLAQDAFYIEENYEITYRFIIAKGRAQLNQFKVVSTTLGNKKINMEWDIIKATVTYSAQRNIKIQRNRRRRRWIGGGRRRCTWKKVPRGVNNRDIALIQAKLHSTMNKVGSKSSVFVQERVINMKSRQSRGTCAAWNRVIKLSILRGCSRRSGVIPKAFSKAVNPLDRKIPVKVIPPFQKKLPYPEMPYLGRKPYRRFENGREEIH